MTERFRVMCHDDYELNYIADTQNDFRRLDLETCCELLNELNDNLLTLVCESQMVYERNAYKVLFDNAKEENLILIKKKLNLWNWIYEYCCREHDMSVEEAIEFVDSIEENGL